MSDYDIHLDDKYGSLTLIELPADIAAHEPWFNQTLTTVNDAVVVLEPHQDYTVPRQVEHRTRAPVRTAILMVEAAGVQPNGD